MALYRYSVAGLEAVDRTTLAFEQVRERHDLQRVIRQRIEILGDDLLVVAEEYSMFEDSRRRIDLLALDRTGTLVVIELKRTEDGGHMELQALRYAAMVSTMKMEHLINAFSNAHQISVPEAREAIGDWVEEPFEELANSVRVMLVSPDFSTEITSTVLWLNENYNTDISCHRIVAYRLGAELLLDIQQIIPLPEAKDFQIQQRQKGAAATAVRATLNGRDFTRYDLTIGEFTQTNMSKQGAIKAAIKQLFGAGVSVSSIQSVLFESRWIAVHPGEGETVEEAFARENPSRSPAHRWYDLDVTDDSGTWVIPRFGGTETERMLDDLAGVAAPIAMLRWSRTESTEARESSI